MVRGRKRILLRNEAQLNCVPLRSSLHYVGLGKLSRVEMNAQKTGALDGSPNPTRGSVFSFLLDNTDVVIEGMLRQSLGVASSYPVHQSRHCLSTTR